MAILPKWHHDNRVWFVFSPRYRVSYLALPKERKKIMKKIINRLLGIFLILTFLVSAAGCRSLGNSQLLSMGFSPKTVETKQADTSFKTAMAELSLKLFRESVTKDEKNDNFSPLSAILCLSLVANGADGETKAQMEELFGMSVVEMNKYLKEYVSGLYSGENCKVELANSIWLRNNKRLHIEDDFLQTNADYYGCEAYVAPFDASTVKDVNSWVKKNTDGLIEKILDEIEEDDMMFLINTLLFDAKWLEKYKKNQILENRDFTNYDGSISKVNYLSSEENRYFEGDGFKGFLKGYEGGKYSFAGILPDEDVEIYSLVEKLNCKTWIETVGDAKHQNVDVRIPEFKFETDELDLTKMLRKLGMTDAFDSSKADFSKMGYSDDGSLYLSYVKQKTYIAVDRNGTKAAAVTWSEVKPTSVAPIECKAVYLDRPFIYAIVDNETGLPLFIGAVTSL